MLLSICIPTFNRAAELGPLLHSIMHQIRNEFEIEVVISDNASTDDTSGVAAAFAAMGLPVAYHQLPVNVGFDRNIINAVQVASGTYCWLFGSDDVMMPGALDRVIAIVQANPDLAGITVGLQGYNQDLSGEVFVEGHTSADFDADTRLIGREEVVGRVGIWLGFISSLVVRRSSWVEAVKYPDIEPYLFGYVHIYIIAKMLGEESVWMCVPDRLVGNRSGNDSFRADDEFARTRLDMVGYDVAFGDNLGRRNPAYHQAMNRVAGFYIRSHFFMAKMRGAGWRYWRKAVPMTIRYYWRYPAFWLRAVPYAVVPRGAFLVARAVYRLFRKRAGQPE